MSDYPEKQTLSAYAAKRLPANIKDVMERLVNKKLSADCIFEEDSDVYLYLNLDDADKYVLIASSGQGDEWLLKLSDNTVWFLDHGEWEEPEGLKPLEISFEEFVIMADLLDQSEKEHPYPRSKEATIHVKELLRSINEHLVWNYPFAISDDWMDDM